MKLNRGNWTEEDTATLLRLRKEGVGYRRIGAQLNRTPHACMQRYSNKKQPIIQLNEKQSGLTRNNKKWSVVEDRLLKRMMKDERSMEDMIQELKRSEKAIAARMWMHTRGKKRRRQGLPIKVTPAKVETSTDIGIENFIDFIRALHQENKELRAKLESIRSALK